MRLIYLSLSWIAGIYLGDWSGYPWVAISALAVTALLAIPLRRPRALLLALCLIFFLGGILRIQSTVSTVDEGVLRYYNDRGTVQIQGLVADDPEPSDDTIALKISTGEIERDGEWIDVSGTVLVYTPNLPSSEEPRDYPYYRYGDLLSIKGTLQTPPVLEDFDYREYLARKGIHSIMHYPARIELIAEGQGAKPQEWIYALRNRMSRSLDSALHEPQDSLAQAILLGKRSTIPDEIKDSFAKTGTSHLLAISGLHVGILAGLMLSVGVWLFGRRRPSYFLLALIVVWGYALLSGLHAPVLRASIMGSLWLFADYIGRPNSALTSLLFAAALMLGIHPSILGEVSFQLSFAAMAGLVLLTPRFQSLGRRLLGDVAESRRSVNFVITSLSITLGAVLATLPIVAFYFHKISLVALPANFFALPALPGIITTVALVGVIGLFAAPLAQVLGWVSWLFISYMTKVIELFAALPFSSIDTENVGAPFVWGYYAVLGAVLWLSASRTKLRGYTNSTKTHLTSAFRTAQRVPAKFIVFPLLIVASLIWLAAFTTPDNRLHVYFLDVGQGDAVLIRTPAGHNILVDGGPPDGEAAIELGERLPFWKRSIDLVVLTHPHQDHLGGLVDVLKRYDVEQVLESGAGCESAACDEWQRLIAEQGIESTTAEAGQRIELGEGITLEVLHPPDAMLESTGSDTDNNSVVLRLVYQDFSLLLTGDIFGEAEDYLLAQKLDMRSAALKIAHHGSDTSTITAFLDAVDPQVAVISAGAGNPFGHPSTDVLDSLSDIQVYRTDEQGTIELISDGERLWVKTER